MTAKRQTVAELSERITKLEANVEMLARLAFSGAPAGGALAQNLGGFVKATEPEDDEERAPMAGFGRRLSDVYGDTWKPPEETEQ